MSIMCSPSVMAAVLMIPVRQLPAADAGKYCFSTTVQRHLIDLQMQAGHRAWHSPEIHTVDLEGLTEAIIQQQLDSVDPFHGLLITLPNNQDILEVLDV